MSNRFDAHCEIAYNHADEGHLKNEIAYIDAAFLCAARCLCHKFADFRLIQTIEEKNFQTAAHNGNSHNHSHRGKFRCRIMGNTFFRKSQTDSGCHLRFVLKRTYDGQSDCRERNAQSPYERDNTECDSKPGEYGKGCGSRDDFFDFRGFDAQLLCVFDCGKHVVQRQ